jgi:hypothetical protein
MMEVTEMKAEDFLQCGDCKAALEEFAKIANVEKGSSAYSVLAEFALFKELRELRATKVNNVGVNSLISYPGSNGVVNRVNC